MTKDNQTKQNTDFLVNSRLAALEVMDLNQLRKEWELYNNKQKAPNYGRKFMIRKQAQHIQAIYYGGLKPEVKALYDRIARENPKYNRSQNKNPPKIDVLPGTRFIRVWRGQRIEVEATKEGFLYDNQTYRSLSAVARAGTYRFYRKFQKKIMKL